MYKSLMNSQSIAMNIADLYAVGGKDPVAHS